MEELIARFEMLPPGCRVLCAVSGGADSVYLLYRLALLRRTLDFQLVAAHFNHRLRGAESDRDEAFVASFLSACCGPARRRGADGAWEEMPGVPLVVGSGDVAELARRSGRGVEDAARRARYDFLFRTARELGCDRVATAHTQDDNIETMLLHLLRGSGLRGLTGIAPVRGMLIRPMLTTTRREVEDYLRAHGLPHVEDSSNGDMAYTRNRLRHQVLPLLEELQPGARGNLVRAMELLGRDEALLEEQAARLLESAREERDGVSVDARALAGGPEALSCRAVRQLLGRLGGGEDCSAAHLTAVTALCRGEAPSARISLPGGVTARRVYGRLELTRRPAPPPLGEGTLPLPGQVCLGGVRITARREERARAHWDGWSFCLAADGGAEGEITVRPRRPGDRLALPGRPAKTLKKLMIEEKIPRHLRESLPVLEWGGRLAAVAGLGPDAAFLPREGGACWHITCRPEAGGERLWEEET